VSEWRGIRRQATNVSCWAFQWLLLAGYLHILKECFDEQDHVLRAHLRRFKADLDAALEAAL